MARAVEIEEKDQELAMVRKNVESGARGVADS